MAELGGPNFQETAEIVLKAGLSSARVSELAARLISEAVRCMSYRKEPDHELSSTVFVLTAYLYLRETPRTDELNELAAALATSGLKDSDWLLIARDVFIVPPAVPAEDPSEYKKAGDTHLELGLGFRMVLQGQPTSEPVSAPALLRELIENTSTGIHGRVQARAASSSESADDSPAPAAASKAGAQGATARPPTSNQQSPTPTSGPGRHVRIVREATVDELGLNVGEYAKALATILRVSEGEFSFALFGKWGSGKTTLLKLLKPLLEDPAAFRKSITVPASETYADLRYRVVVHNAWKYRNPPEAWIYLYKSLATAVMASATPVERWALALRLATNRSGYPALLASLAMIAVALTPIQAKAQLIWLVVSALGLWTVIYLVAIWMGASSKVKQLFQRNLKLVGRHENLGMLALIGDDVGSLLKGWTKERDKDRPTVSVTVATICVLVIAALWALGLHREFAVDLSAVAHWVGLSWETPKPSVADATHWAVLVIWSALSLAFIFLPRLAQARRPDKVLLVVDDLDRCTPEEMLGVIENVRLLLDDEEVNSRMQVLMLVDEHVLNHAIEQRYATMIAKRAADLGDKNGVYRAASADIRSEQIEKLFACHLRLPRLSPDDVKQLVTKLAGYENEQIRKRARAQRAVDFANAVMRQTEAQQAYNDLVSGKPASLVPEDAPSKYQPSIRERTEQGIDYVPLNPAELSRTRAMNKVIEADNARIAAMTPEERLKQRPGVAVELEVAKERRAATMQALESLPQDAFVAARPSQPPFEPSDVRFSDEEITVLTGFVPKYLETTGRRSSPRSIKAFLFKLQLARLLMQLRYPDLSDGTKRMENLLAAFEAEASPAENDNSDPYTAVVRQVL